MGLQVGISISEIAPHLEDLSVDAAVTKTIQNVNDQDAVSVSAIPEHCPLCREKKLKDTFLICEKSKGLTQKVDEIIEMICSGAQLLEYICDFFIVNTNSSLNCRGYKHTKRKLLRISQHLPLKLCCCYYLTKKSSCFQEEVFLALLS